MMQLEIVKEWIEKAEEDYGFASTSIEYTDYFAQICFHFQQAAEKYLKAFIIANDLEFRPIHNLLELLEICRQIDSSIEEFDLSGAAPLPSRRVQSFSDKKRGINARQTKRSYSGKANIKNHTGNSWGKGNSGL